MIKNIQRPKDSITKCPDRQNISSKHEKHPSRIRQTKTFPFLLLIQNRDFSKIPQSIDGARKLEQEEFGEERQSLAFFHDFRRIPFRPMLSDKTAATKDLTFPKDQINLAPFSGVCK